MATLVRSTFPPVRLAADDRRRHHRAVAEDVLGLLEVRRGLVLLVLFALALTGTGAHTRAHPGRTRATATGPRPTGPETAAARPETTATLAVPHRTGHAARPEPAGAAHAGHPP